MFTTGTSCADRSPAEEDMVEMFIKQKVNETLNETENRPEKWLWEVFVEDSSCVHALHRSFTLHFIWVSELSEQIYLDISLMEQKKVFSIYPIFA